MLLDVNVLLALAWPNHQHHHDVHAWFAAERLRGWRTCAITELGFIRLSSNPSFTSEARSAAEAAALLEEMTAEPDHQFVSELPAPVTFRESWPHTAGYRQTTDVYLACVARHHELTLATLDGRLARHSFVGPWVTLIPTR